MCEKRTHDIHVMLNDLEYKKLIQLREYYNNIYPNIKVDYKNADIMRMALNTLFIETNEWEKHKTIE